MLPVDSYLNLDNSMQENGQTNMIELQHYLYLQFHFPWTFPTHCYDITIVKKGKWWKALPLPLTAMNKKLVSQ